MPLLVFLVAVSQPLNAVAPTIDYDDLSGAFLWVGNTSIISNEADPKIVAENILVEKMAICESTDNPLAINLIDKDGTSSYGRFQFKWQTLKYYVGKYKLADVSAWEKEDAINWAYDGEFTEKVFRKMLYDKNVNWKQEFPTCYRKNYRLFVNFWAL